MATKPEIDEAGPSSVGPADQRDPGDGASTYTPGAPDNTGAPEDINAASTSAAATQNEAEVLVIPLEPISEATEPSTDPGGSQQQQPPVTEPLAPGEVHEQSTGVTGISEQEAVAIGEPEQTSAQDRLANEIPPVVAAVTTTEAGGNAEASLPSEAAAAIDQQQPPGGAPTAVVTRREVRELSEAEIERTAKALLHMMQRHGAEEHSEFFRVAGIHGYPGGYCHHAQETFPSWHRFFLVEFEQALRAADRALGNDGAIGCPYWDWTREEVNGQVFPALITRFFDTLPEVGTARPLPLLPPLLRVPPCPEQRSGRAICCVLC